MGLSLRGQTSGAIDINAPNVAGNNTITLPGSNGAANQFYKNSGTAGTLTHSSMVEDSSGKIGIGTVSPSGPIHAHVASGAQRSYLEASASHSFLRLKSGSTSYNSGVEFFSGASNIANINGLGAGGLQFEVNGSERLHIDTSGNAVLKAANAAFKSENPNSSGDYIRMYAGAGTSQWDIYTNGELLRMSDNSSSATAKVQFDNPTLHRSTSITPGVAAVTAKQEVNNGGYLLYDGRNSSDTTTFSVNHNGTIYTASGLNFGTPVSPVTSQTLDDYEEGTWSPVLAGETVAGTMTGNGYGIYTKIGRQVSIGIRFENITLSGATGTVMIKGLPFNGSGSQAYSTASAMMIYNISFSTDRIQTFYHGTSTNDLHGIQSRSGTTWISWDVSNFQAGATYMNLEMTYQTST